jgi:hypothetical protein
MAVGGIYDQEVHSHADELFGPFQKISSHPDRGTHQKSVFGVLNGVGIVNPLHNIAHGDHAGELVIWSDQ